MQVNAIHQGPAATGSPGSSSGYFRSDKFKRAPTWSRIRVLPYSDQQFSETFGGPLKKDPRPTSFANYEYERQPQTFVYNSIFPAFKRRT